MTLSKREKVLIYMMVMLGLLTAVYFFVFIPMSDAYSAAELELEDAQNREATLQITKLSLQNAKTSINDLSGQVKSLKSEFYHTGENDQLDTEVIQLLWKYNLTPVASSITPPTPTSLPVYGYASDSDGTGDVASLSYVYTMRFDLQFKGTRENFASLLSEIAATKGMRAVDFTYSDAAQTQSADLTQSSAITDIIYPDGYVPTAAATVETRPGESDQDITFSLELYMLAQ